MKARPVIEENSMTTSGNVHRDGVIDGMLKELAGYLPHPVAGLPAPGISVASVIERPVGLNNRVGTVKLGEFPVLAVKGIRLDALVRFQSWAAEPGQIDTDFINLNSQLMADRDALRSAGFLRLALENTAEAENIASLNAWRKQADYRVLYESQYLDTDGALGLIARIPITDFLEQPDSEPRETSTVSDRMICWNNTNAFPLALRGPFAVSGFFALVYIPGANPTGTVTLTRTFDGAKGAPKAYHVWKDFLAAVSGANAQERNSQVTFASLQDFLGNFRKTGDTVAFGDLVPSNPPDIYTAQVLSVDPAIDLTGFSDRLELSYQNEALDQTAVLYLRATGE